MISMIKYELKQFIRQRFWLVLFMSAIILSIILPRENFEDITVLPSVIYFIMGFTLLFIIKGAEEARQEKNNRIHEMIRTMPHAVQYYVAKLIWIYVNILETKKLSFQ